MAQVTKTLQAIDPVWGRLQTEANDLVAREPLLGGLVHSSILHHQSCLLYTSDAADE